MRLVVIPRDGDDEAVEEALRLAEAHGWPATVAKGGRPRLLDDQAFRRQWDDLRPRIEAGEVGKREAARLLGCDPATVLRLLKE